MKVLLLLAVGWDWLVARIGRLVFHVKNFLKRFVPHPWGSPPVDDTHRIYREQYESAVEILPTMPIGDHHETRKMLLFKADVESGLHNYGDHPHADAPRNFAGLSSIAGGLNVWLMAGGIAIVAGGYAWGGVEHLRAAHETARADRAVETAAHNAEAAVVLSNRLAAARMQIQADQDAATATAATIERERLVAAFAARRERERQREIQNVLTGGPAPAWSLRPSEPTASSGDSGQPDPAAGRS